jgi:hypothetical protein
VSEEKQSQEGQAVHDQEVVVAFNGFKRQEDGSLYTRRATAFDYEEREGQLFKKGSNVPVPSAEAAAKGYETRIQMAFTVIAPAQFYGEQLPYSCSLKGIKIINDARVEFPPGSKMLPGLIATAIECGFNRNAVDASSALFDQDYVEKYAAGLTVPVTPTQVVDSFLEPILTDMAAEGHLELAHTQPGSNWIKTYTFKALSADEADKIWAKVQADQSLPEESAPAEDPDEIPFPGTPTIDVAALKQYIKEGAGAGHYTPAEVCGAMNELGVTFDPQSNNVLDTLTPDGIVKVYGWAKAKVEPSPASFGL